jgi:lipoyl-dependent peroxiredoxin subunit D
MQALETLRQSLPEAAKDIRTNIQSVLETSSLSTEQRWGVALACATASRYKTLRGAVRMDALAEVDANVVDDAHAAAVLMGMNNVFYRFRHLIGKPDYGQRPARLRMNRLAQPATNRTDFELLCLAVSSMAGCQSCLRARERAVLDGGLTEEHVHDAVRIAATMQAAAIALDLS